MSSSNRTAEQITSILPIVRSDTLDLRGGTLSNGCAAHTSSMLQRRGYDVKSEVGAGRLVNQLESKGWERVPLGSQQPGDVGVGADWGAGPPGSDHVYTVLGTDPNNPNTLLIADNQVPGGGTRPMQGGGKTDTEYFLRPPPMSDTDSEAAIQKSLQEQQNKGLSPGGGNVDSSTPGYGQSGDGTTPAGGGGGGSGGGGGGGGSGGGGISADEIGKLGRTGEMMRRNMAFMSHTIKILGDFKMNPGMVVHIDVQKSTDPQLLSLIQGLRDSTDVKDEYISGQYYVTECTHSFKNKSFYTYVTINRDSSSLNLE